MKGRLSAYARKDIHKVEHAMEMDAHQSAIAHELGKVVVGAVLDLLLEDTQRHGLLDHIIVIGDVALVDTALERLRRVISTI